MCVCVCAQTQNTNTQTDPYFFFLCVCVCLCVADDYDDFLTPSPSHVYWPYSRGRGLPIKIWPKNKNSATLRNYVIGRAGRSLSRTKTRERPVLCIWRRQNLALIGKSRPRERPVLERQGPLIDMAKHKKQKFRNSAERLNRGRLAVVRVGPKHARGPYSRD